MTYLKERLNPNEVILRLAEISRMLDSTQQELAAADEAAVRARQRFEVGYSRSLLTVEASNADSRKARATIETADARLDAEIADQKVRALRSRLSVLRDQVEVGRSLSAALRSEWAAT